MIRTISTGDLGFDVLLGGGWRLVKRFEERESATVVVRGGSGAGKTLVAIQVAVELARALDGDVAVGCVEILPTEYIAQLQAARPTLAAERVAILPARASGDGPRVYVGLLPEVTEESHDLVSNLETLDAAVVAAGGNPKAFVVDSLIEGYGIGSSAPRIDVDDVLKFAARYGYALVLCEEVGTDGPSPWVFAADTVLQLGVDSRPRGRWIEVRKHRFGPSATDRHQLDLSAGRSTPRVYPEPSAWQVPWRATTLDAAGWPAAGPEHASLQWAAGPTIDSVMVVIANLFAAHDARNNAARHLARRLERVGDRTGAMLAIELNPLVEQMTRDKQDRVTTYVVPVHDGPARLLRRLLDAGGLVLAEGTRPGRIVLGDVGTLLAGADPDGWLAALRAFAAAMSPTPLVIYDQRLGPDIANQDKLRALAETWIEVARDGGGDAFVAVISGRWTETQQFAIPAAP